MKNFKVLFIVAACTLTLVHLDAAAVEIYYFDHPSCASADYKGDVLETCNKIDVFKAFGSSLKSINTYMEGCVEAIKAKVAEKFEANIICGGNLDQSFHTYDTGLGRGVRVDLTLLFTGTAMKTT